MHRPLDTSWLLIGLEGGQEEAETHIEVRVYICENNAFVHLKYELTPDHHKIRSGNILHFDKEFGFFKT